MDIEKAIGIIEKEIGNQEYDLENQDIPLPIRAVVKEDIEAMKLAVEALQFYKKERWIPIEEFLPNDKTYTVPLEVTTAEGRVEGEMWYGRPGLKDREKKCFYRWDDEMWQCFIPEVIAWRPYPKPYEKAIKESEKNKNE